MTTITVGRRGQIVIPKNVRKDMGIEAGSKLEVRTKKEKIILRTKKGILDEKGSLKGLTKKTARELVIEARKIDKEVEKALEGKYR